MTLESRSKIRHLKDVHSSTRGYLEKLMADFPLASNEEGMALFLREGDDFYFVPEARAPISKTKYIAQTSVDVYKGGGGCFIRSQYGTLVVPDGRGGGLGIEWYKYWPVGLANWSDGEDLLAGVKREFDEETFIYSLDHKKQFVPKGALHKTACEMLDFTVGETVEFGEMVPLRFYVNELEKAYEFHALWDITGLKESYSAHYDEDHWFRGGRPGIPVVALNEEGLLTGFFSGQQGFIRLPPVANLHPSVAYHLGLPAPVAPGSKKSDGSLFAIFGFGR